eukprot:1186379-Prorocentrum_minimum.AAC.2
MTVTKLNELVAAHLLNKSRSTVLDHIRKQRRANVAKFREDEYFEQSLEDVELAETPELFLQAVEQLQKELLDPYEPSDEEDEEDDWLNQVEVSETSAAASGADEGGGEDLTGWGSSPRPPSRRGPW